MTLSPTGAQQTKDMSNHVWGWNSFPSLRVSSPRPLVERLKFSTSFLTEPTTRRSYLPRRKIWTKKGKDTEKDISKRISVEKSGFFAEDYEKK